MRRFLFILVLLAAPLRAEVRDVPTVEGVSVFLVNDAGRRSQVYAVPATKPDVKFKVAVDRQQQGYSAATLEIIDPARGLTYRSETKGQLPDTLHWDGQFNETETITPGDRYSVRLILTRPGGEKRASPVVFFVTRERTAYDDAPKVTDNQISLYVIPAGAFHVATITTKNYRTTLYPSFYGDITLVWRNVHAAILRFEATSNVLFNFGASNRNFFYSEFSLAYRYRLAGAPLRAPILPASPPYGNYRVIPGLGDQTLWGKPFNAEVGVRFFSSTLRGAGVGGIDRELARSYQGVTATLHVDRALGPLRFHLGLEGGYTVLRGALTYFGGEAAITYDRFEIVSPGLELRYSRLSGNAADDAFDGIAGGGPQGITNELLLFGAILRFRL